MNIKETSKLWKIVKILPTDYDKYGGGVARWAMPGEDYPDCSCGCAHWYAIDNDWGICAKEGGPRAGLLTWEHQGGYGCFEPSQSDQDS